MKYPISFIRENDKYIVKVPDLTGCEISCDNIDQGFYEVELAIADHLKILAEYGENIPVAKNITDHQNNAVRADVWALVDIDITPFMGRSHKINVTLPELLIKQIDNKVSRSEQYKTRSGFIASACLNELKK